MSFLTRAAPALFVLLWSTGFVGAKFGLPFAEPFWFLCIRLSIASSLLLIAIVTLKTPWPKAKQVKHIAVAGLLIHAAYLGGVFWAIKAGMPAGIAALVLGLQPVLTAVFARLFLTETLQMRQWLGLALGLIGVFLVLSSRTNGNFIVQPLPLASILISLFGITLGTIYQKKHLQTMPLLSGTFIQYSSSAFVLAALAFTFETRQVIWSGEFIFALSWLISVLSFGAVLLLFLLIRNNAASQLGSLFYLVPVATAIESYFLFNERLSFWALVGLVITVIGVALVVMPAKYFQRRIVSSV